MVFTEGNFAEQVLKVKLPVLVDFYADWCVAPETNVLLENGSQIEAAKITFGQRLPGIGNHGLALGCVTHSRVARNLGHCQEVVLSTGRKVKVTGGHLFYGAKGWATVKDLKVGDKIAVLPGPNAFSGKMAPVKDLVLARLVGLLFTDGTLYMQIKNHYYEVSFSLGQKKDVNDLTSDLRTLGFSNVRVAEVTKQQEISGRKFVTHVFRVKCSSKDLLEIFKSRGVPVGAKKAQGYLVPSWIKNGDLSIKREFLRGFLGGDGPKVDIKMVSRVQGSPYNKININDLEFHKNVDLEKSGLCLAQEVAELLKEFGVVITKVFAEQDIYLRRDGQKSSIIHLVFKHDLSTALNLVTNIGYAYSAQKESASQISGEFLRQIFILREGWQDLYKKVIKLASSGLDYREISRTLGIAPLRVYLWTKGKAKATVAHHKIKFNEWLAEACDGVPSGFIWEKVKEIRPVFLPAVAKITVGQTNSFITNGILSHNCSPCKMMAPVLEQLAQEYDGEILMGKLNVDESSKMAEKYGVMSIPTLIIFKNGEPVKQMVGLQDKVTLQKQIDEVLAS